MAVIGDRFQFLFRQFVSSKCTKEELQEFYERAKQIGDEEFFQLMDAYYQNLVTNENAEKVNWEFMFRQITQKRTSSIVRKTNWRKYVAAAAIIIVVAMGSYFAFFRQTETLRQTQGDKPIVAKQNDLLPGGNKAILTLDGGKTLILDNAKNGALAVQGNTQVVKGDGTLAYNEQQQIGIVQKPVYNSVSTPKGGQYQLTLADGSKVWLNAASSIRFPTAFIGNERKVEITGEVYFEVAHDVNKPFHVSVLRQAQDDKPIDIQVLGTHFDVNAYSDEENIKTTLLEGSVKVTLRQAQGDKSVIIKPGEQAQLNAGSANGFTLNRDVNIDQVMAWKNGVFNFDNVDLQTIMRQLARWYDVDVLYQGAIANEPFKGKISRNVPASKVLDILAYAGVHFKIDEKKIIVMP